MLTDALVLPRMRATKNRQLFFLKKKQEIQKSAYLQQNQRLNKQEGEIFPYYLRTLNKLTRSKRPKLSLLEQFTQPNRSPQKQTISYKCQLDRKPSTQIKRGLCFNRQHMQSRRNDVRSQSVTKINITIGNGNIQERIKEQNNLKDKRKTNLLKFKRLRQKKTLTHRILQSRTARDKQKFSTVEQYGFEDMISKTKYLHPRPQKKYLLEELESTSLNNKFKQLTPQKQRVNFSSRNLNEEQQLSLKTEEESNIDRLQRKYNSVYNGINTTQITKKKPKKRTSQVVQKADIVNFFNTFNLTGWRD